MRKGEQAFNARLIKKQNGKFVFDPSYPMERLADWRGSKGYFKWANASMRDRLILKKQLKGI